MKGRFWKTALAAAAALLIISGNVPFGPVAELFGDAAVTASAEDSGSNQGVNDPNVTASAEDSGTSQGVNDPNVEIVEDNKYGKCGDNATWRLDPDTYTLTISGTGAMNDYEYRSHPWYAYEDKITSVEIENGITSIGNYAFYECTVLTSITIPDSVTSIGANAFFICTGLTSITIPDSVESIGNGAFASCAGLTSITISNSVTSIGDYAFFNCTGITDVYCNADPANLTWNDGECNDFKDDGTSVCHVPAKYYLEYVKKFGAESESPVNVTFDTDAPHGQCGESAYCLFDSETVKLTISGTGAMYDYNYFNQPWYDYKSNITSVEIGNDITSIGSYSFIGCHGLTSITIPDSVTSIDADAFYDCTNITDVYCYADPKNLTWDDGGCDDFKGDGSTVCHVPAEDLDTYNSDKFSTVNVRFVGDLVDMGLGEHLYGHSITLDGSIGVNFYVELTDELLESDTAEMVFTVPNGSKTDTQTLLVKDVKADSSNKVVIGGKTYYKFKCSVSAKDMASEITAQMFDGEKAGTEYKYSVKDYADYLLSHTQGNTEFTNAAPLVKAMLSYGAYSQTYFGEGTPLADSYKAAVDCVAVPVDFEYKDANASLPEGVTFEGATLSLKSETTLSLYFKGLPANTTFTCSGKTVDTSKNGEYVVARIRGIKANELQNDFTVKFGESSVKYNAMTYCYNVLNGGSNDEDLQNVCKALYQYSQAANEYSGSGIRDDS